MRLLMNDLRLNEDRPTLKRILENAIPKTYQDIVIVYVSVEGIKRGELTERNYVKKIYPVEICGLEWSAIQVSTASGVCAVVDLTLGQANEYKGLVYKKIPIICCIGKSFWSLLRIIDHNQTFLSTTVH